MDEKFVLKINPNVGNPLRPAATLPPPKENQVSSPQLPELRVQRHLHPLLGLLAGVALQVNSIQEENQLGKARTVQALGRIPAPEIGAPQQLPRRALDGLGRGPAGGFPNRVRLGRAGGQKTRAAVGQLHPQPVRLPSGQFHQVAHHHVRHRRGVGCRLLAKGILQGGHDEQFGRVPGVQFRFRAADKRPFLQPGPVTVRRLHQIPETGLLPDPDPVAEQHLRAQLGLVLGRFPRTGHTQARQAPGFLRQLPGDRARGGTIRRRAPLGGGHRAAAGAQAGEGQNARQDCQCINQLHKVIPRTGTGGPRASGFA